MSNLEKCATALSAVLMFAPMAVFAQSQEFKCEYAKGFECGASGCRTTQIGSRYLLLSEVDSLVAATTEARLAEITRRAPKVAFPTIRRCDADRCDSIVVRADYEGVRVSITGHTDSFFLKVYRTDMGGPALTGDEPVRTGDFVEVVPRHFGTTTYFGFCPAIVKELK